MIITLPERRWHMKTRLLALLVLIQLTGCAGFGQGDIDLVEATISDLQAA